jgi:hypothetical protein
MRLWNGSQLRMPVPSPSKAVKSSMTMNHLSRAGKSQTSIVRMVRRMPHRLKFAGRQDRVVPQVSAGGGIAAGVEGRAVGAPAEAEAVGLSSGLIL